MKKKPGIALFVYNRPDHTRQVLNGLERNKIDKLYIFSDGPKGSDDKKKVEETRDLIDSINWCQTEVIKREKNWGLADSIVDGVNYVFDRHERIIVLEDDCVPSADFVTFMEQCFDKYEDNERVMNITGYSLPIKIPEDYPYDIYFSYRSSSWGWGTWRRAWKHFERDENLLDRIQDSPELKNRVERAGLDLIPMLKKQIEGQIDSWAVYWSINIAQEDGVCLKPVNSFIKNIGHDNSGVHCGDTSKYDVKLQNSRKKEYNLPNEIIMNDKIVKRYGQFISPSLTGKIKGKIAKLLSLVGLYKPAKLLKDKIMTRNDENHSL